MPPEPLDRKDFFKERKHDRSDPSFGFSTRWRGPPTPSSSSHYASRWGPGDFRRPPGYVKKDGWHLFNDESGNEYTRFTSNSRIFVGENYQASDGRRDGRYIRNNRDYRGSFGHRDRKNQSWEMSNGSPSGPGGRLHDVNYSRPVSGMSSFPVNSTPDLENSSSQLYLKDQHENKEGNVNESSRGQSCERGNSLGSVDWKPLKWTRSGSLSSRGSGFSNSNSSKNMGAADLCELKNEILPRALTPIQSLPGNAAICAASTATSEDTASRKKPRLGWGQGLAKYEKKKVDSPDMNSSQDGLVVSVSHSPSPNVADKSPRVMGISDCASPATPSSVACSFSPGVEEKSIGKTAIVNQVSNLCTSPSLGSQSCLEAFPFNLEKMDSISICNLGSSLNELFRSDDPMSVDSNFVRSTALNKLLVWKGDILKMLETTESEIDLLENELVRLNSELGKLGIQPVPSEAVRGNANVCKEHKAASECILPRLTPLEHTSCVDHVVEKVPACNTALEEMHPDTKDGDINSPGTATSKFVEQPALVEAISASNLQGNIEGSRVMAGQSTNSEPCSNKAHISTCTDRDTVMKFEDDDAATRVDNTAAEGDNRLCTTIWASNKESASMASEFIDKLMKPGCSDVSEIPTICSWRDNPSIQRKFTTRKRYLRYKERVLTLKFKAFQHLWKEDMRLLSLRKHHPKSQKKCDSSFRSTHVGHQKHRSSIRSRFSSPTGNLSLVPTAEIVDFTRKLLSDTKLKVYRDNLKMPNLILDEKEKTISRFVSDNGLVEDPCAIEKEKMFINPWSSVEKETFINKLATHGKDFRKIASFLDHKTTADCVDFYYKNHKSDCFEKIKKKPDHGKLGKSAAMTYMVTSGCKWNRKMSDAASLDLLGTVSVMAANADHITDSRKLSSSRIFLGGASYSRSSQHKSYSLKEKSGKFDLPEKETVAADVLAGICSSISSEAMGSCITNSVDPGGGYRDWKTQRVGSAMKWPSMSSITQTLEDDTSSGESCGEVDHCDWTDEERSIFIQAISSYGKDFPMISRSVRTKTQDECKIFFGKARKCLGLDSLHPLSGNMTCLSDDVNGGGSGMEDVCVLETSSVICNGKLGTELNAAGLSLNISLDQSDPSGPSKVKTGMNESEEDYVMGQLDGKEVVLPKVYSPCQTGNKLDLVSSLNTVENQSQVLQLAENDAVLAGAKDRVDKTPALGTVLFARDSSSDAFIQANNVVPEVSSERSRNNSNGIKVLLLKADLHEGEKSSEDQHSPMQDSSITRNDQYPTVDSSSCSGISSSGSVHKVSLELDSTEKPPVIPFLCVNSPQPPDCQFEEKPNKDSLRSTVELDETTHSHRSTGRVGVNDKVSVHSPVNLCESSQILRGYPLQIPTRKDISRKVGCEQLLNIGSALVAETCALPVHDFYFRKCSSSKPSSSVVESSSQKDQMSGQRRSHSRSLSDTETPNRNGDVKLFGKILTTTQDNNDKGMNHARQNGKSSIFKFNSQHKLDGNLATTMFDDNNHFGLENIPIRSYGFWDGNRIQTGYSALPDSALLLAHYPTAFCHNSTLKQQQKQGVLRGNECSSLDVRSSSVYPPIEISGSNSSNGILDYPIYRNCDVQPFAVDMKQNIFTEMQRRNGFESIPSLQQQQHIVGMNGIGSAGILASGVSDPVAAIKMHYSEKVEEEQRWRKGAL